MVQVRQGKDSMGLNKHPRNSGRSKPGASLRKAWRCDRKVQVWAKHTANR